MVSIASIIVIGIGVAALGASAYYTYNLLIDDSPSGQLARSRLGLDKYPGWRLATDPKISNYKPNPSSGGYTNKSKDLIEDPTLPEYTRKLFKEFEKVRAEKHFGKANAGFSYTLAAEQ